MLYLRTKVKNIHTEISRHKEEHKYSARQRCALRSQMDRKSLYSMTKFLHTRFMNHR